MSRYETFSTSDDALDYELMEADYQIWDARAEERYRLEEINYGLDADRTPFDEPAKCRCCLCTKALPAAIPPQRETRPALEPARTA